MESSQTLSIKCTGSLKATEKGAKEPMSSKEAGIYVAKYNRFVDNILDKMNDILRKGYDPVIVKLQPIDASKQTNTTTPAPSKKKTTNKKKTGNKKKEAARTDPENVEIPEKSKNEELTPTTSNPSTRSLGASRAVSNAIENPTKAKKPTKTKSGTKSTAEKDKKKKNKNKKKGAEKKGSKKPDKKKVSSATKDTGNKTRARARGTLYGLSSLRRRDDVTVTILHDHTSVRAHFSLGPLVLKVEKEVGRDGKKELKSATATTSEMSGRVTLHVDQAGVATLHSIRVLQPQAHQIGGGVGARTWRHVAALLTQQLEAAARTHTLTQTRKL